MARGEAKMTYSHALKGRVSNDTKLTMIKNKKTKGGAIKMKVNHPYKVGSNYLIRTVTMIYTGKLEAVYDKELVISSASWIAETERWADSVATGKFKEVEPYPDNVKIVIGRGAILDAVPIDWKLPREQK